MSHTVNAKNHLTAHFQKSLMVTLVTLLFVMGSALPLTGCASSNGDTSTTTSDTGSASTDAQTDENTDEGNDSASDKSQETTQDFSVQKAEFTNRLASCEEDDSARGSTGSMAEMAQAGSDLCDKYSDLMEDVLTFLKGNVLSSADAQSLDNEQSTWKNSTENRAIEARDGQGRRSGYAMALDYSAVYLSAYPDRIQTLIDRIPGEVAGSSSSQTMSSDSTATDSAGTTDSQSSTTVADGWYEALLANDAAAGGTMGSLSSVTVEGDVWTMTGTLSAGTDENGLGGTLTSSATWTIPVATDAEFYALAGDPVVKHNYTRDEFEQIIQQGDSGLGLIFHVSNGRIVAARLAS